MRGLSRWTRARSLTSLSCFSRRTPTELVKAVFSIARRLAPCIVFIDELDALFQSRTGGGSSGGDSARRQMLTGVSLCQLLLGIWLTPNFFAEFMQEMDGLNSASQNRKKGLVVIGATNRPQDLDEAGKLTFPGGDAWDFSLTSFVSSASSSSTTAY